MTSLLDLPNELILGVVDKIQGRYRNRDLQSLSLVCKRFQDVAQERLLCEPMLKLTHIQIYLWELGHRPTLQHKVQRLEIFSSNKNRELEHIFRAPTATRPGQSVKYPAQRCPSRLHHYVGLLPKCSEIINYIHSPSQEIQFPHTARHREAWQKALKSDIVAALFGILLVILPNLKELYLGATWLMDFPVFRSILHSEAWFCIPQSWEHDWLNKVFNLLKDRLEVLEFPTNLEMFWFRRLTRTPFDFRSFPKLRYLSVPMAALHWCGASRVPPAKPERVFPPTLELLRISECNEYTPNFMNEVCSSKKKNRLPDLAWVELYFIRDLGEIQAKCQIRRCPDPVHDVRRMFHDAKIGLYLWFPGSRWSTPEVGGTPWSRAEKKDLNETELEKYGEPDWISAGSMEWRWDVQGDVEMLDA